MNKQWLETQFQLNPEKKKADLAKALGLEAPAISKILGGIREVKAPEYVIMRKFFGLPSDGKRAANLSQHDYVIKPLKHQNARGGMQDNGRSTQSDWIIPAKLMKEKTDAKSDQIKSFRVAEDAMSPDFKMGEYLLIDTSIKRPSPSGVFLISDGLGEIVRQCEYIPQSEPPSIKITAKKEGYESFVLELNKDTIIGRVLAKIEWVG